MSALKFPSSVSLLLFFCWWSIAVAQRFWPEEPRFVLFSVVAGSNLVPSDEFLAGRSVHWDASFNNLPKSFRSSMLDRLSAYADRFGLRKIVAEMRTAGRPVASAEFRIDDAGLLNISNWFNPEQLLATRPFWIGRIQFSNFSIVGRVHRNQTAHQQSSFRIHGFSSSCADDFGLMGMAERDPADCSWSVGASSNPAFYYARRNGTFSSTAAQADQFLVYIE